MNVENFLVYLLRLIGETKHSAYILSQVILGVVSRCSENKLFFGLEMLKRADKEVITNLTLANIFIFEPFGHKFYLFELLCLVDTVRRFFCK